MAVKMTLTCDACKNSSTHTIDSNSPQHVERYAAHHNTCKASPHLGSCAVCGEVQQHGIHHMTSVPSGRQVHAFVSPKS